MTHFASFFSSERVPHDPNAFKKPTSENDSELQDETNDINEKLRERLEEED